MTPLRDHATRLCTGSAALGRQFTGWLFPRQFPAVLLRLPGSAAAAWFIGWPTVEYEPRLLAPAVCWWCVEAWRGGGEVPGGQPVEDAANGPDLAELVEAMHALADPHVHLAALARALGLGEDTAPVRALLKDAGVPTKTVRMGGRPSTGVDRAAFPPLPSPASGSPGGDVVAGQGGNGNSNNGLVIERGEGMTIIRNPAETELRRGIVPGR